MSNEKKSLHDWNMIEHGDDLVLIIKGEHFAVASSRPSTKHERLLFMLAKDLLDNKLVKGRL